MEKNKKFADREYWDARFNDEAEYEWFDLGFHELLPILSKIKVLDDNKYLKSVLMLGTGNSSLPLEMAVSSCSSNGDGFLYITSIDFSSVALDKMKQRSEKTKKAADRLEWFVADLRDLPLKNDSFDIIIEKGTLDVFFVGENDPWKYSENTKNTVNSIIKKVWEILPIGGVFVSISFAQPHFRLPFFVQPGIKWSLAWQAIRGKSSEFDYFAYTAVKCSADGSIDESGCLEKINKFLERPSRSNGAELLRLSTDDPKAQFLTQLDDELF